MIVRTCASHSVSSRDPTAEVTAPEGLGDGGEADGGALLGREQRDEHQENNNRQVLQLPTNMAI
jgi:hypothetical protein